MQNVSLGRGIVAIITPLEKVFADLNRAYSENERILDWAKKYGLID